MARDDEWPGIAPKVLAGFNQMLAGDFKQTIERFLAIQAMGSEHARDDIRQLRHWLAERPAPQLAALEAGLGLLAEVDLRDELTPLSLDLPCRATGHGRLIPWCPRRPYRCWTSATLRAAVWCWK
jgi:pimeloyl-[acyl-carrier protein] methyl ester esterase